MYRSVTVKLKVKSKQLEQLLEIREICSLYYNQISKYRSEYYKETGKFIGYIDTNKILKSWDDELDPNNIVFSQVKQNVCKRHTLACEQFFQKIKDPKTKDSAGWPKDKKKPSQSFTLPQHGYSLVCKRGNVIYRIKFWKSSGLGTISLTCPLVLPKDAKVKTLTIKLKPDNNYYAIISYEVPFKAREASKSSKVLYPHDNVTTHFSEKKESIGIDFGVKKFITFSDGRSFNCPAIEKEQKKLDSLNKAKKNKEKELKKYYSENPSLVPETKDGRITSRRLQKLEQKIAKQYMKIFRILTDFLHKIANYLVANYKHVYIEDLNMLSVVLKNKFGRKFGRKLLSHAWGRFIQILEYKAELYSSEVIKVDPAYTSQLCVCGAHAGKVLANRVHRCASCGIKEDRDVMSARVIEILGNVEDLRFESLSEAREALR